MKKLINLNRKHNEKNNCRKIKSGSRKYKNAFIKRYSKILITDREGKSCDLILAPK